MEGVVVLSCRVEHRKLERKRHEGQQQPRHRAEHPHRPRKANNGIELVRTIGSWVGWGELLMSGVNCWLGVGSCWLDGVDGGNCWLVGVIVGWVGVIVG